MTETHPHPAAPARPPRGALFKYAHRGHVRTNEQCRQGAGTPDYVDRLADLAEDEDWDGLNAKFTGERRILNYVGLAFQHAQEQEQARESSDGTRSTFNTIINLGSNNQTAIGDVTQTAYTPAPQNTPASTATPSTATSPEATPLPDVEPTDAWSKIKAFATTTAGVISFICTVLIAIGTLVLCFT